ncbi:MAG: hypothetical protein JNL74_11290 [Fibrobacteres bacterium]|nr:hypothetical protein [Fibrobacterota bacterium]
MASNLDFKKYQDFRLTNINVKNTSLIRKVLEEYYSSDSDTKRKLVVTDYFNNGIWDLSVHNYFAEKQGTLYRKFADTQKEEHIIECSGEHEIDDINTGPPECIVSLNESLPSITNFFYWKIEDEMNAIRRLFRISPADNLIDRLYEIYESLKYNIEFNVKDREVNVKESGVSSRVRDEYTPNYTRTEHAEVLMLKRYLFSRKGHVLAKLWDSTRPDIANDKRAFNIHTIFNVYSKIKSSKIRDINKLMERYADEKVRHERNYA